MEIEKLRIPGLNTESYSVHTTEDLLHLTEELHKSGRINGAGYDVFGTLLSSLYSRPEQTSFLSKRVADFLSSRGLEVSNDDCFKTYTEIRDIIKNGRKELPNLPAKQQECPEAEVIEAVGNYYHFGDNKALVENVEKEWLNFDLQNTRPVHNMPQIISHAVQLFGREKVGLFTNNSCNERHLLKLLQNNGYIDKDRLNQKNVFVSSEFGVQKYGVGVRKPNVLAFQDFSSQLSLVPSDMAFIGDGGNDVLFATNAGGVGIRLYF